MNGPFFILVRRHPEGGWLAVGLWASRKSPKYSARCTAWARDRRGACESARVMALR